MQFIAKVCEYWCIVWVSTFAYCPSTYIRLRIFLVAVACTRCWLWVRCSIILTGCSWSYYYNFVCIICCFFFFRKISYCAHSSTSVRELTVELNAIKFGYTENLLRSEFKVLVHCYGRGSQFFCKNLSMNFAFGMILELISKRRKKCIANLSICQSKLNF